MFNQPFQPLGSPSYGFPMYHPPVAFPNTFMNGPMTRSVPSTPSGSMIPGTAAPGQLPMEESYIENILRLNLGKLATIYMTFENNTQWNAKVFKGRLEAAGRDHIIISDPKTGIRYLLLMVNLDYITFDEPLNYTFTQQATPPASR